LQRFFFVKIALCNENYMLASGLPLWDNSSGRTMSSWIVQSRKAIICSLAARREKEQPGIGVYPRAVVILILTATLLAGCASSHSAPPPFAIPLALTTATHYIGTPLSGPRPGNASEISYRDALDLHATWFALEQFDGQNLPLLASQARLITAARGGSPMLPSGNLTSNARIVWIDDGDRQTALKSLGAGRRTDLGDSRTVLPAGVTVSFRAIDSGASADQTLIHPELRFLEVSMARLSHADGTSEKLQIAVSVEDDQSARQTHSTSANSAIFQIETAVLEHSIKKFPATLLVVIPFKFTGPPNQADAALITISPASADHDFADAIARCKIDLQSPDSEHLITPIWAEGLNRALDSLADPKRRRAGLVFLAGQCNARICMDVASVCDDEMLQDISRLMQSGLPPALKDLTLEQFAWVLDRSAVAAMQPKLTAATLPAELFTVLTLHMGEPGRHAASVDAIMRGASNQRDLFQRLVAENYIYLEDSSPASRVRAYQWLQSNNIAPAGFDPLGTPRQRRNALDKALDDNSAALPPGGAP
jgi:hypothetical protein